MRLIDANLLKAEFTGNFVDSYATAYIKAIIDTAPTVDAEPIIHAKIVWKRRCTGSYKYIDHKCTNCTYNESIEVAKPNQNDNVPYCSNCGKRVDDRFMNYCSNCGAKLDLK